MLYPIAIEMGDEQHAYGVVVPDIPGCFSAGDTLEEAFENVKEAIVFHIEGLLEDGEEIPMPADIKKHMHNSEYERFTFSVVDISTTLKTS